MFEFIAGAITALAGVLFGATAASLNGGKKKHDDNA